MLRAITFDVWETLIHDPPGAEDARLEIRARGMADALARHGWPVDPAVLADAYRAALPAMEATWAVQRDFDTPEQVGYVLGHLRPALPDALRAAVLAEAAAAYARAVLVLPPSLSPDAPAVLADVARRGLRVGVVCNTGRTPGAALRELFRGFDILGRFDSLTFSNEERLRKPDPEVFHRTLGRLGVAAADAAHVGDDATTDVLGARRAGMRAVLLRGPGGAAPATPPDARLARLGELPALLDEWAG